MAQGQNTAQKSTLSSAVPNDLEAFFMPFTANRQFKKNPRLLVKAKGVHYWTPEGRKIIDGTAGLWCVNAGHCRPKIVAAVQKQVAQMDFAPTFNMGHPIAFEFADRLARLAPERLSRVFFTNSAPNPRTPRSRSRSPTTGRAARASASA